MPPSNYDSEVDPNNTRPLAESVPAGTFEPANTAFSPTPTYAPAPPQPYPQPAPVTSFTPPAEPAPSVMPPAPQPAIATPPSGYAPFPAVVVSGSNESPNTPQPVVDSPKRKLSKPILLPIVGVLVLTLAAAAAYMVFLKPPTPDGAFKQALVNALTTKSLTQNSYTEDRGTQLTQHYDLSTIKQAKIDATFTIGLDESKIVIAGYGSPENSYFRITKAENTVDFGSLKNKWVQVKKDGKSPEDVSLVSGPSVFFDPDYSTLGDFIFGNFDAKSRKALVDYALANQVYKYDNNKVKKIKLNGHDVYAYDVQLSAKKLEAYNRKAAPMFGIADSKVDNVSDQFKDIGATMYVALDSERLIQVKTDEGDTTKYSVWDSTTVTSEPKPEMQIAEFSQRLEDVLASPSNQSDSANGSVNERAQDTERKTDMNALQAHTEAYYATNGYYPTLAEINDASWRSTNMRGLDPDALKDPVGDVGVLVATPTAGRYAYQVGADASLSACQTGTCLYYKLTTVLHDGTPYSKESF